MQLQIIPKFILMCLVSVTLTGTLYAQSKENSEQSMEFSVVSVRKLSGDEALERAPHTLVTDLAVRLRLNNSSSKSIYFLTYGGSIISIVPIGFNVKRIDDSFLWLYGRERNLKNSPDIEKASAGLPTQWLILPPHSSIEWERLDATFYKNEQHAFTIFVKEKKTDEPLELISDFFTIPPK